MNLLISILMFLGLSYTPPDPNTPQENVQDINMEFAKYVRDNNLYTVNEEGVVIDVDVNP